MTYRGMIDIHSSPAALCPHVEWAIGAVLSVPVDLDWQPQGAQAGALRAQLAWSGGAGSVASLASALRSCKKIRFDVTQDAHEGEGHRYSFTPALGMFHATTNAVGDIVISEQQLRNAMTIAAHTGQATDVVLNQVLGAPWDAELEIFRHAQEQSPVRWLHHVS